MLAKNNTPFAAAGFEHFHRDGQLMGIIVCRASYDLAHDGSLSLRNEQNLIYADEFSGPVQNSALLKAGDIIPFRPNTDITITGFTYAPDARRSQSWTFGIRIGLYERILRCYGPRDWVPAGVKNGKPAWHLTEPAMVDRVLLDYRYAQGSVVFGAPVDNVSQDNPIGAFLLDPDITPKNAVVPAALIENPAQPVCNPFIQTAPQGLSPVSPFWKTRLRFAGTYSDIWQEKREPELPQDFDYRFYQAASPGMIYRGFMAGDEKIVLHQLTYGGGATDFCLPAIQPYACFEWRDGRKVYARLNLDGVHLNLMSQKPPWRLELTWRVWAVICPDFLKADLYWVSLGSSFLGGMACCDVCGLAEGFC